MQQFFNSRINDYAVNGKRYVNLDNAATTPPFQSVEEGVQDYLTTYGSVHRGAGEKSKLSTAIYEHSREIIKRFVGAPDDAYVIFTGNTTGGMNTLAHFFSFIEGKVAVSSIEHSSSWLPWIKAEGEKALGSEQISYSAADSIADKVQALGGKQVLTYGLNRDGEFDLTQIENLFKSNHIKALVLTASSNLTGYCPDIKKIGEIVHRYGAFYIVDGCQFIQHHPIDMMAMGIDFLVASGHKFYAPYGGGFAIGPKAFLDKFLPYQIGGGNLPYITSEGRFLRYENQLAHDPGTPNAVGAVAMGLALEEFERIGIDKVEEYETNLTKRAYAALSKIPQVKLLVPPEHLSTVIPFIVEGQNSNKVAERLNDDFAIGVRAGNFCVYHVVRDLLQITPEQEQKVIADVENGNTTTMPGVIRASFSLCNTSADVDRLVDAVREISQPSRKEAARQ